MDFPYQARQSHFGAIRIKSEAVSDLTYAGGIKVFEKS